MSDITVKANALKGIIEPPPFKSEAIRLLILYALSGIHPTDIMSSYRHLGDDITNSVSAIETAFFSAKEDPIVFAGESATLVRLLAPVLLAKKGIARFEVLPSLYARDMNSLEDTANVTVNKHDDRFIEFRGEIKPNCKYIIDASTTSQFASGLLLASTIVPGMELKIIDAASKPYIDLTIDCIRRFGFGLEKNISDFYRVLGSNPEVPEKCSIEPDLSYAANYIAADFIMNGNCFKSIEIPLFDPASLQPDAAIVRLLGKREIDISDSPDLFPILCAAAMALDSDTVIHGTKRLRYKESDRVDSVDKMLKALGGGMDVFDDHVVLHGCGRKLSGGTVNSFGDHRIVMAAAIASLMCADPITILGFEAVNKSAPQFFEDFRRLGGIANEHIR